MKRSPIRRKSQRQRSWADPVLRRMYVLQHPVCEYNAINGCRNAAMDAEHYLGRGWQGADDPRCLLALCRRCHAAVGRSHAAVVNGVWIKLRGLRLLSDSDWPLSYRADEAFRNFAGPYRSFVESASGFLFTEIENWIDDGSLSEAANERAKEVLEWCGIRKDGELSGSLAGLRRRSTDR